MIVHPENKIAVLLQPKTGTSTLRTLLSKYDVGGVGVHDVYNDSLDGYKVYCFYRDPVERCLSALKQTVQSLLVSAKNEHLAQRLFGDQPPVIDGQLGRIALPSVILNYIPNPKLAQNVFDGVRPQTMWLDHENVIPLDYNNFSEHADMLCGLFGVPYDPTIEERVSEAKWDIDELSQEEIDYIKQYYAEDYAFFTSKGLSLT